MNDIAGWYGFLPTWGLVFQFMGAIIIAVWDEYLV